MLPLLQDDQDGYLRALGASEILTIHGESSGHVEYLTGGLRSCVASVRMALGASEILIHGDYIELCSAYDR